MRLVSLPEGAAYVSEGRFFRRGRDATSGGDDEDAALTRALACDETRWTSGTWSPDRAVRDLRAHDVLVVLGDSPTFVRMGDVSPGSRVVFDGVVQETRVRGSDIEARRTDVVLSEVVTTYVRDANALVEVEVVSADGAELTIVGTPRTPHLCARARGVCSPRRSASRREPAHHGRWRGSGAQVYNIEVAQARAPRAALMRACALLLFFSPPMVESAIVRHDR